jgi:DNA-binding XRE family transcriptional regulator
VPKPGLSLTSPLFRAARALLGWNQSQLAKASGCPRKAIYKVERDADLVHLRTRKSIQLALMIAGVSFTEQGVAFKSSKLMH